MSTSRVVLVTGAGNGLGRSHVLRLVGAGAAVAMLDIEEAALAGTVAAAEARGGRVWSAVVDVCDRAAVDAAVAAAGRELGGLNAVISNAGIMHARTGILDTDDDEWDRVFAVHVGGSRNVVRAAVPLLLAADHPRIVLTSSLWAQRGPGFGHAYAAAKGALIAFTRNLAVELGPAGVCVNAVAPGSVPTRMASDYGPEDIAEDCETIPLGRWGVADEISAVVAFLASEAAGYVSGQTIAVNGGQEFGGA
ncbi:SDR family NAD(P)-dependent oxidoreductase [Nocardia sp. alder85J]|uniref:SDR family NAD(P)-dependent oxidoreductase n=1 Tax=Nocardia sp. alder85J TaxID=2862949 RepID=UPI001CD3AA85|nr:SDR family NAD(P)-dependent oxidoreductase [Nocardia sp. alder85J]MCX4094651.1 SDR family NAD(P)-dependent oxidoreductase [Nocardia sp. alder85J]